MPIVDGLPGVRISCVRVDSDERIQGTNWSQYLQLLDTSASTWSIRNFAIANHIHRLRETQEKNWPSDAVQTGFGSTYNLPIAPRCNGLPLYGR